MNWKLLKQKIFKSSIEEGSPRQRFLLPLLTSLGLIAALSGCGKDSFLAVSTLAVQEAPGTFTVPAKVDILLVTDNTQSINETYYFSDFPQQIQNLLNTLDSNNEWDYHFVNIPLASLRQNGVRQVIGSRYDGNWDLYGLWKSPFPGALPNMPGLSLPSQYFRTLYNYGELVSPSDFAALGGREDGLETITTVLNSSQLEQTKFLRRDAILVVFVISNQNDTSGAESCYVGANPNNVWTEFRWNCSANNSRTNFDSLNKGAAELNAQNASLSDYINDMNSLVTQSKTAQVRFYSAVAHQGSIACLGGNSKYSDRYISTSAALNGKSYDICHQQVSSIFGDLNNELQVIRQELITPYVVISEEPKPSTIQISIKRESGVVENLAANEFEYICKSQDYSVAVNATKVDCPVSVPVLINPVVDPPIILREQSGYIVQLRSDKVLRGKDKVTFNYIPQGVNDASK